MKGGGGGGGGGAGEDVLMSPPSAVETTAVGAGEENGGVPQAAPRVEMGYEPRYQRCVTDEAEGSGVNQNAGRSGGKKQEKRNMHCATAAVAVTAITARGGRTFGLKALGAAEVPDRSLPRIMGV